MPARSTQQPADRVEEGSRHIAVQASEERLSMHYFDSRGVFRLYGASFDDSEWKIWRDADGFSQRFTGTLSEGGKVIAGLWQLSRDNRRWDDDLRITYRRRS